MSQSAMLPETPEVTQSLLKQVESQTDEEALLSLDFSPSFAHLAALVKTEPRNSAKIQTFEFSNVTVLQEKKDASTLTNISGFSKPNELFSILGPDRTAQTKLLHVLAGKKYTSRQIKSGRFLANEADNYFSLLRSGFVCRDRQHLGTSTVEEELWFACTLRCPLKLSEFNSTYQDVIDDIMTSLNLPSKTQIKKLSKEMLVRVAIGVELCSFPNVLCVDQPFYGQCRKLEWETLHILLALQRLEICQVVVSLFEPRPEIFRQVSNHFLLLGNSGEFLSMGNVQLGLQYFLRQGYGNAESLSPGDFLLLCAQYATEGAEKEGIVEKYSSLTSIQTTMPPHDVKSGTLSRATSMNSKKATATTSSSSFVAEPQVPQKNLWIQFRLLFLRELRFLWRERGRQVFSRFISIGIVCGLCAIMFNSTGHQTSTYSSALHFSSLLFPVLSLCFGAAMPQTGMMFQFKLLMLREQSGGAYALVPALLSKLITECIINFFVVCEAMVILYWTVGLSGDFFMLALVFLVMIESVVSYGYLYLFALSNSGKAVGLTAFSLGPQILFMGSFARLSLMPSWLSWINYVCNITWAVKALTAIEFTPTSCSTNAICAQWAGLLKSNFVSADEVWFYFLMLMVFFFALRFLGIGFYYRTLAKIM